MEKTALLIVDMINDFHFERGDSLYRAARDAALEIRSLRDRLTVPVVYVNDNFKQWHRNFDDTVTAIEKSSEEGRDIISILRPRDEDYYVLKPDRSGFYETPLEVLLRDIRAEGVIVTGVTTDMCVLHTANDAYIRGFKLAVPADCTASIRPEYHTEALSILERTVEADIRLWRESLDDVKEKFAAS